MARKSEPVTGRLPTDTYEDFVSYCEEKDISQSDALRRLIRAGLESEKQPDTPEQQYEDTMSINENARLIGGALIIGALIGLLLGAGLL